MNEFYSLLNHWLFFLIIINTSFYSWNSISVLILGRKKLWMKMLESIFFKFLKHWDSNNKPWRLTQYCVVFFSLKGSLKSSGEWMNNFEWENWIIENLKAKREREREGEHLLNEVRWKKSWLQRKKNLFLRNFRRLCEKNDNFGSFFLIKFIFFFLFANWKILWVIHLDRINQSTFLFCLFSSLTCSNLKRD